jgi:phosphoribosylformylglycinamidine synthase
MALAGGLGCRIDLPRALGHAQLFGEDQARYVVTCRPEQVEAIILAAKAAGVPASWIGSVSGNAVAILGLATVPLTQLRSSHEGWFPAYMAGEV